MILRPAAALRAPSSTKGWLQLLKPATTTEPHQASPNATHTHAPRQHHENPFIHVFNEGHLVPTVLDPHHPETSQDSANKQPRLPNKSLKLILNTIGFLRHTTPINLDHLGTSRFVLSHPLLLLLNFYAPITSKSAWTSQISNVDSQINH